jgi:zinc transport system substrate-binding protein
MKLRFLLMALLLAASGRAEAAPRVIASIRPLQSLAAMAMEGVATPDLLIKGAASPHSYTLRPSDAAALHRADIVLWTGEAMETFLVGILPTLGHAKIVAVKGLPGVALLAPRRLDGAESDSDDDGHGVETWDGHLWLSPDNAAAVVSGIAALLAEADPANAARYKANAAAAATRLAALKGELTASLSGLSGKGYIAGHDAYQYFDRSFGLAFQGAVEVHPDRPPSARHILALNRTIAADHTACMLTEPSERQPIMQRIAGEHRMTLMEGDPLGVTLAPGPALYPAMLKALAATFKACLG